MHGYNTFPSHDRILRAQKRFCGRAWRKYFPLWLIAIRLNEIQSILVRVWAQMKCFSHEWLCLIYHLCANSVPVLVLHVGSLTCVLRHPHQVETGNIFSHFLSIFLSLPRAIVSPPFFSFPVCLCHCGELASFSSLIGLCSHSWTVTRLLVSIFAPRGQMNARQREN